MVHKSREKKLIAHDDVVKCTPPGKIPSLSVELVCMSGSGYRSFIIYEVNEIRYKYHGCTTRGS